MSASGQGNLLPAVEAARAVSGTRFELSLSSGHKKSPCSSEVRTGTHRLCSYESVLRLRR